MCGGEISALPARQRGSVPAVLSTNKHPLLFFLLLFSLSMPVSLQRWTQRLPWLWLFFFFFFFLFEQRGDSLGSLQTAPEPARLCFQSDQTEHQSPSPSEEDVKSIRDTTSNSSHFNIHKRPLCFGAECGD